MVHGWEYESWAATLLEDEGCCTKPIAGFVQKVVQKLEFLPHLLTDEQDLKNTLEGSELQCFQMHPACRCLKSCGQHAIQYAISVKIGPLWMDWMASASNVPRHGWKWNGAWQRLGTRHERSHKGAFWDLLTYDLLLQHMTWHNMSSMGLRLQSIQKFVYSCSWSYVLCILLCFFMFFRGKMW